MVKSELPFALRLSPLPSASKPMVSITNRPTAAPYTKTTGMVPIPGYTLIEPLGRGGFGEVWKCEAPGGLLKAVKFVAGNGGNEDTHDNTQLQLEYEAFQQVKSIRHPYLLCLERVELVGNELVMVMGLADRHIGERFQECRRAGLSGIPREEVLGYLKEAAEALDVIGEQYGLQHLDVKPANLFLTAGHLQVGDYGLVSKLDGGSSSGKNRGLTPKYAAPEVLRGEVHTRSDQYSLALVYQEMLTGTFPFTGRTPQQMMLQHVGAAPDLSGLPTQDRIPVATALAKNPDERFASCQAFIAALSNSLARRLSLITPQSKNGQTNGASQNLVLTPTPRLVTPQTAANARAAEAASVTETTQHTSLGATPPSPESAALTASKNATPQDSPPATRGVKVEKILSVLPVGWLRGREAPEPDLPPNAMVRAILDAATATAKAKPAELSGAKQLPDGTWTCRFLSTIDPRVAKVRLGVLWEQGKFTIDTREEGRVIIRQVAPLPPSSGLFTFGKKSADTPRSGLKVVVNLPESGGEVREVNVEGWVFGSPPPDFAQGADQTIRSLLEGVQRELGNFQERRKHPRIPAEFPVVVYPMHHDGCVETPLNGRCRDVSAGGLVLRLSVAPTTKYAYVAFEGVRGTTGLAVLFQITRTNREAGAVSVAGRYRLEFWQSDSE